LENVDAHIREYIIEQRSQRSRYDIDLSLLKAGYEPDAIDSTWQQLKAHQGKSNKFSLRFRSKKFCAMSLLGLAGIILLIFFDPGSGLPTTQTRDQNYYWIWAILGTGATIGLYTWSKFRIIRGYKFVLLVGALICLGSLSLIFFAAYFGIGGNFPIFYTDLDKLPVKEHEYHLIYAAGCCDGPDYHLELYKCSSDGSRCSEVENVITLVAVGEEQIEFGKYHLALDNTTGKIHILKAGQVVYTFRST
jgi:hypothetical protein